MNATAIRPACARRILLAGVAAALVCCSGAAPARAQPAEGANSGRPDAPALCPIDAGAVQWVRLDGRLGDRYKANVGYLEEQHKQHRSFMLDAFRLRQDRKKERDWDGEYAGKWLDAAGRVAADTGNATLKEACLALAADLRKCQGADGYMGIEAPDQRGKAAWDVWNQWYALTGWLTCHERLDDWHSWAASQRAARWLTDAYAPIDSGAHRFFQAAHEGGCNVDVCDQLMRLYGHTRDARLLAFVRQVRDHYKPIGQMRRTGEPCLMHPYVLLAALGAMVELAVAEQDPKELAWIESVWDKLRERHLYPTGSLGLDEKLTPGGPNDAPGANHQETCATVEWLVLCRRLYLATGNPRYVEVMERTVYNALLAAQSEDGKSWTYFTPLRYEKKWFGGPTKCCYWSGPRAIAMLPEWVYAVDKEGVRRWCSRPMPTRAPAAGSARCFPPVRPGDALVAAGGPGSVGATKPPRLAARRLCFFAAC